MENCYLEFAGNGYVKVEVNIMYLGHFVAEILTKMCNHITDRRKHPLLTAAISEVETIGDITGSSNLCCMASVTNKIFGGLPPDY